MDPYHYPDDGPIAFRAERDLGDVIRATLQWMREMAGVWIPAVATVAGPFYLLSAILGAFIGPDGAGVLGLVDGAAGLLMSGAVFGILRRYRMGQEAVSIGEAWDDAKAWLGPLFGFGFVTMLFAIVLAIPFIVIAGLAGTPDTSPGVWIGLGLAGLAVMVLAAPYYAVGLASRVFDEDGAVDAYKRASGLVAAHRGFATGAVLVMFGLVYFIAVILATSIVEITRVIAPSPALVSIASVVSLVALVPAAVFGNVAATFLFETLVEREEGTLLDAEIEAIREGSADEPVQRPVPPPREPERDGPDTRSFAERLRDDRAHEEAATPPDDASSRPGTGSPRGGFRGGGFEDGA